jgi:DNA invertase Pin-like site-specific DNA recombinase
MKTKSKAYGYVRVSGKAQLEGDGFARQEKAIRLYAKANGVELVKVYQEEGVSGTLEGRPALAALMVDLEQNGHGVKMVLIEKVDRLARDLMVQEAIINDFKEHGFSLVSVTENEDLLSQDPTRKLVRQVLGAIAEYDKSMLVLKLAAARERKKRLTGKCEGRKSYAEDPRTVMVLEEIRRLRRKPKGGRRMTFEKIAEELNAKGLRTMDGKEFTGNNVAVILHRVKHP